jgi:transglutaminase/protease-like cytokinesis protein 3
MDMRRLAMGCLILVHLVFAAAALADEGSVRSTIDEHALDVPEEVESSLEDLAEYLAAPARNDEERAWAVYRWITANIDYDVARMTTAQRDRTPEEVLADRKGVCSEYSALFSRLCEFSGLEAVVISGYGKGYGYSVGSKVRDQSNHAWNGVKIDGEWRLVDTTWGAGYLDPQEGFVERFEEFYFLTPPEELIWTHLPQDPDWQLLDVPMSKEEFEGLVCAKPAFFNNDIDIVGPLKGTIDADEGANVTLSAPQGVAVIADLLDEVGQKLPQRFTMVRRSGDEVLARAACPGPGNFTFRIYSRRCDSVDGAYDWTLDYRIVAGPNAREEAGFPVVWDSFWDMGLDVGSHPEGVIFAGSELNVTLSAPEGVLLLARLLDGDGRELSEEQTFAQREEGGYVVRAAFPKPGNYTLRIYAKRGGGPEGEYTSVIEYAVLAEAGIEGVKPRKWWSSSDGPMGGHNL